MTFFSSQSDIAVSRTTIRSTPRPSSGFDFQPAAESATPPALNLTLLELRALPELAALAALYPALLRGPRGDGHPVLLLPGLLSSDWAMKPLAGYLRRLGYAAYGWGLGTNRGPIGDTEDRLKARLDTITERHGCKATLIGSSLGGIYGRQLAKVMPDRVRRVVTLGSPYSGSPRSTRAWRLYEWASGLSSEQRNSHLGGDLASPLPVPATSLYSFSDGICAWQSCISRSGALTENVRVPSSHLGMPHNPFVFHIIANRLALTDGAHSPFPDLSVRELLVSILQQKRQA